MMRLLLGLIASLFFFQAADAAQTSISEIYLGSREGDPASLVENVSTINGDYTEGKRFYLKGVVGDQIHATLVAVAHNFRTIQDVLDLCQS